MAATIRSPYGRVVIRKIGRSARLRSKKDLAHKPLATGTGKWHSRTSLWAYKRRSRKARLVAAASRRRNRTKAWGGQA